MGGRRWLAVLTAILFPALPGGIFAGVGTIR